METTRLLETYRDVVARLRNETAVPTADASGSDFLDIAQSIEQQELARLATTRLADRAKRLRIVLRRVADGEYGLCAECGASIPPKRLLAMPDATTCVTCQARLEGLPHSVERADRTASTSTAHWKGFSKKATAPA